jgi:methionyl-tRNA synthetase
MPLPRTVFAHGWLQVGGEKMSKTRLTGISPHDLVETFGSDAYRYYFVREINFGLDGEFSWEGMVARYNADLANDLGNLVSRVLNMIARYLDGTIPAPPEALEPSDKELRAVYEESMGAMEEAIDGIAPHDVLKAMWRFVRKANAYVEEVAPWALAKEEAQRARLQAVLYNLADSLRLIALIASPVCPRAAQLLWERLALPGRVDEQTFPDAGRFGLLPEGSRVTVGDPLFPRIEEEPAQAAP